MEAKVKITENGIQVPLQVISKILKVSSKKTIDNYVKKGMPFVEKGKIKEYDVLDCVVWAMSNGILPIPINLDIDIDRAEMTPSHRKDLAIAEEKEFKLDVEKGKYIRKDLAIQINTEAGVVFREGIMSLPDRNASELASESDPVECKRILERESRRISNEVYNRLLNISTTQ